MGEQGKVIEMKGKLLQLEIPRSAACGGCKACVPMDGKNTMTTFALNECGAKVGDTVEIAPGEGGRALPALILYGIPLVVFVLLVLLFTRFLSDLYAFLAAFGGLVLCYLIVWLCAKKMNTERFTHRAVRLIASREEE